MKFRICLAKVEGINGKVNYVVIQIYTIFLFVFISGVSLLSIFDHESFGTDLECQLDVLDE